MGSTARGVCDEFVLALRDFDSAASAAEREAWKRWPNPYHSRETWCAFRDYVSQQAEPAADRVWDLLPGFWQTPVKERAKLVIQNRGLLDSLAMLLIGRLRDVVSRRALDEFKLCLIAIVAAGEGTDYRDRLTDLCRTWHAAERLGLDARSAFYEVAERATPDIKPLVEAFPARSPDDRSLKAFGIERDPFE